MRKKIFIALTLMLTAVSSWGQILNIGGHRAVYDEINTMWLCSISQSCFGDDFTATVNYGDSISNFTINDIAVASGEEYVFEQVEGGKQYAVTAMMHGQEITGYITFTWLPLVELYGDFSNYYHYGSVVVNEPDSAIGEPMFAKLKWRGHSTLGGNKHNYRIKFLNTEDSTKENHRFFGLRNDNTWILDAGQRDFLRVRNHVNLGLWQDMARRAWYTDTLPNARKGSRGKMVEVMLNGSYLGIYNMCEPLDRKQLKLKRYDEEKRIFHGVLWEATQWTRTVTMSNPEPRIPGMVSWDGFQINYPDYGEIGSVYWKPLENAVYFAGRADEDMSLRVDSMGEYFDLPVMQDYFIFITTIQALDNESKNIYYACYDAQTNKRLTMFPWDTDISLGANITPSLDQPEIVSPERNVRWISHMPMVDMLGVRSYWNELCRRYKELRKTTLNTDSLVNRYRSVVEGIMQCGAGDREQKRWSRNIDLAWKVLDLNKEMDYVEDWLRRRMPFLDNYYVEVPEIIGDVNLDGEVNIADINALIDIILNGGFTKEADVNGDGEVNIADINAVIDIILNS